MRESCETIQTLISGCLDGELSPGDQARLEEHLASCEVCRKEFERMKTLVAATDELGIEPPPEEVWDTFLEGVYNRAERQTGWFVFIVGAVALAAFGVYLFVVEPWASAALKLLIATPIVGLLIVFISVLRQRLFVAKTDRYSREIKR